MSEDLNSFEQALRALVPTPVDRDTALFRAGQAAAPRRWLWPGLTCVSSLAALVFGLLLLRPTPQPRVIVIERTVYLPAPQEAPVSPPMEPSASSPLPHHQLQERLLTQGLAGLGESVPPLPHHLPPLEGLNP